jgi:hypothetical protein
MSLEYTTPVPNRIFDIDMSNLKEVELKVLLVVIRKTHGWVEQKNHRQRRQVQRINIKSFETLTGCSKRGISTAIQSLVQKQLVIVYDYNGKTLTISDDRKGKYHLYFKPNITPVENPIQPRKYLPMSTAKFAREPAQNLPYTIKESIRKKKLNEFNFCSSKAPSELSAMHISRHIKNYSL